MNCFDILKEHFKDTKITVWQRKVLIGRRARVTYHIKSDCNGLINKDLLNKWCQILISINKDEEAKKLRKEKRIILVP